MINYIDLVHYFRSFLYNRIYSDNNFISNVDKIIKSNDFVKGVTWTTHPFAIYINITPTIDNPEPMNYKFTIDSLFGSILETAVKEKEADLREEGSKILLNRNLEDGNVDTLYNCFLNNIYRLFSSCVFSIGQNQYQIFLTL